MGISRSLPPLALPHHERASAWIDITDGQVDQLHAADPGGVEDLHDGPIPYPIRGLHVVLVNGRLDLFQGQDCFWQALWFLG